jgi:hypothetical protein
MLDGVDDFFLYVADVSFSPSMNLVPDGAGNGC